LAYKEYILAGLVIVMCTAIPAYGQELLKISQEEAVAIATDAYIYGYPLVTMEMTRRVMTNVAMARGNYAPGQFAKMRAYPSPLDKEVTAPNADTLYTLAWLDVSQEPYILTLPDAGDRYYLMPMLSGWTDVFQSPGKEKEANWLPAPAGKFILMLRFYWPKQAIIDGSWKPPAVVRGEAR
jgi:hypothetical protein